MLTIREPIKLNIADDLLTVNDAFYERVVGNYGMMSASITPKDLLFYLSAPPEIPDDIGGMTTVAVQNSMTDRRAVSMEIVNNVVNRILLSTGNNFTYQDQVYIDNVLEKLGISDVSLFMKQVQHLSEEQNSIRELISLYNEELSLRGSSQGGRTEAVKSEGSSEKSVGEASLPSPRLYLQNEIYKRLETGAVYNIVNAFQGGQSHVFGSFHNNEMKTAEQLFVSKMLMLSDMKERAVPGGAVTLRHIENHFEIGDILPAPASEDAVLSQAAAASLFATVEHALVEKLFSRSSSNYFWLSLERSLSETVENSISRFQSYHTNHAVDVHNDNTAVENTITQYRSEARVLRELINLRRRLGDITVNMNTEQSAYAEAPSMMFIENTDNQDDNAVRYGDSYSVQVPGVTEKSGADIIRENTIRDKSRELKSIIRPESASAGEAPGHTPTAMEHPAQEPAEAPAAGEKLLIEKQKSMMSTKEIAEKTRDILSRELTPKMAKAPATASVFKVPPAKTVRQIELEYDIAEQAETLEKLVRSYSAQQVFAQSGEQEKYAEPPAQIPPISKFVGQTFLAENSKTVRNSYAGETGSMIYQQFPESGASETAKAQSAPFGETPGTAPEAPGRAVSDSEASPELIAREVIEIDRRNREIFEAVKLRQIAKPVEHIPTADREKTLDMSLRALESPEAVMKEIMDTAPPAAGSFRPLSPQAEAYLQSADTQTRKIFEAVMRYEQNPQAPPPEKLFHVGSIGELNAAAAARSGPQASLIPEEGEKLLREKELLSETRDNVLEQFNELPARSRTAGSGQAELPRVPIVHKIEQADFSEELLEKLEQQRSRQATVQSQSVTEEVTDRQVLREITQNDINTQLVSQSAEDITKLVNQTIAKQMNTISDKVYQQMEKRLQTERSRRGRF